jgi:hypothetical protein
MSIHPPYRHFIWRVNFSWFLVSIVDYAVFKKNSIQSSLTSLYFLIFLDGVGSYGGSAREKVKSSSSLILIHTDIFKFHCYILAELGK